MTEQDIKNKNLVLISYLNTLIDDFKIKAEYSTNDNDVKVIVVTETSGEKVVFYDNNNALFNYYDIQIYGDNIEECKNVAVEIGDLIGDMVFTTYRVYDETTKTCENQTWQLIFQQFANPRTIQYMDIRRIAYTMTLKCVVNRVA